MLVLRRKEGSWVRIRNKENGQTIHFKTDYVKNREIDGKARGISLAFFDNDLNFEITRTEKLAGTEGYDKFGNPTFINPAIPRT